jgi:hypothetical protein
MRSIRLRSPRRLYQRVSHQGSWYDFHVPKAHGLFLCVLCALCGFSCRLVVVAALRMIKSGKVVGCARDG